MLCEEPTSPGAVRYFEEVNRKKPLHPYMIELLSVEDLKRLENCFGLSHICSIPVLKKNKFLCGERQRYYILRIEVVKRRSDEHKSAPAYLYNGDKRLKAGRVFHQGENVTRRCRDKTIATVFKKLNLSHFDHLEVFSVTEDVVL